MDESLIEAISNRIDLWRVDLTVDRAGMSGELLSADELMRADKFVFPKDRDRFVRSRSALRLILSRYLDCHAGELKFHYNEHGKPELLVPVPKSLAFNLSHTKEVAIMAVAKGRNVGVDVNTLPRKAGQSLEWIPVAKRSFSIAEQSSLFALPLDSQERMFYRIWSQKEAYTKGIGEGYRYGFQKFTIAVEPRGGIALIADEKNPQFVGEWQLTSVDMGSKLITALACDGPQKPQVRPCEF
jgi:4'-phosphopantetheinyl transferase